MSRALTPGDFAIKVEVKLDPSEYAEEDVNFHKAELKRLVEEKLPDCEVFVVAGQEYWFADNDRFSVRA